ncbi:MAG: aminotransferase class III-fold pyridoxal phosphate-dependent enzyme [Planctomycetota bacterium]|nr:MAG: aminotransferase class III-fold pyridoxal phosphate-dependent enzyme [Planctomycetota bacterium]
MSSSADYARYARPQLERLLRAVRLDVAYERAEGDTLWTRDGRGERIEVLDMVGGFGVGLLGHNHPALVEELRSALADRAPFHAQGSMRTAAGALCRRLSEVVGEATGRRYVVTLANSGAEAVEAALKHAEMERDERLRALNDGYREHYRSIQEKLRNRECDVVPRILERLGERLGLPTADPDLEEVHHHIVAHNARLADLPPLFLAFNGSFHGKTTGALQLTHNPELRRPFRRLGQQVRFLDPHDPAALEDAIREATFKHLDLSVGADGAVRVEEREFVNVGALFAEPIQGEGGIRELPTATLRIARRLAEAAGFPIVFDEIQSGCGRTGDFLASTASGVIGDYYVLSKALGGGLCKVAACLVDSARYRERFGFLHTSTFAEDDPSCRVARKALDLIADPAAGTLARVRERGALLAAGLAALRERYPSVVREVRGRGLMLGVELVDQDESPSPTLRLLSNQGFLGFAIAGYLLHEHRVRVLPTLSNRSVLRLQPSAFIADEAIARFLAAFDEACGLVAAHRADALLRFLTTPDEASFRPTQAARAPAPARSRPLVLTKVPPYAGRVSFLGHFIRPGHLRHWDPGLQGLDDESLARFLERTHRQLEPYVSEAAIIESAIGERVHISFIGLPLTPHQIQRAFREGNIRWVEEKILEGVRLARRQGSSIVGMGGYTSILTGQGTRISEDRVGITSGNAMTVAMGVEALLATAREEGIDLEAACLGALGATGNICALYAQVMAEHVPRLLLVGRPHMERRLRRVAAEVYFETHKLLQRDPGARERGLGRLLATSETYRRVQADASGLERIGPSIEEGLRAELGAEAPVRVATSPEALVECDLIVAASSTPEPVITPAHLGPGPRVICDLALPEDTAPEVFRERPDVRVIRGGIVRLPRNPDLVIAGMPLEPGRVFACTAETLLLGLSRINEHFSWGRVTKLHVEAIRDLARYHGFALDRPSMTSVL